MGGVTLKKIITVAVITILVVGGFAYSNYKDQQSISMIDYSTIKAKYEQTDGDASLMLKVMDQKPIYFAKIAELDGAKIIAITFKEGISESDKLNTIKHSIKEVRDEYPNKVVKVTIAPYN